MFKKLNVNNLSQITQSEQLPYSNKQIEEMLTNHNYLNVGYFHDDQLVTYAFTNISQQVDLIWIYTFPSYRKHKYGSMLIKHIVELTNKHIMLEVNENNKPAINFYKKNGFKIISVRKDYYGSNQNAIIMTLNKKCD